MFEYLKHLIWAEAKPAKAYDEEIDNLYEAIRAGESVDDALAQFPSGFDFKSRGQRPG